MKTTVNSKPLLEDHINHLRSEFDLHRYLIIDVKSGKQRTSTQSNALHLYCGLLAEALNNAGYERTIHTPLGCVQAPWSKDSVKENIWRPVQIALTGEQSTTQSQRNEYADIYDVINRHMIETKSIHVPWPVKKEKAG